MGRKLKRKWLNGEHKLVYIISVSFCTGQLLKNSPSTLTNTSLLALPDLPWAHPGWQQDPPYPTREAPKMKSNSRTRYVFWLYVRICNNKQGQWSKEKIWKFWMNQNEFNVCLHCNKCFAIEHLSCLHFVNMWSQTCMLNCKTLLFNCWILAIHTQNILTPSNVLQIKGKNVLERPLIPNTQFLQCMAPRC